MRQTLFSHYPSSSYQFTCHVIFKAPFNTGAPVCLTSILTMGLPWWHYCMETQPVFCEGTDKFHSKRQENKSFGVFVSLNNAFNKQSTWQWIEKTWRLCYVTVMVSFAMSGETHTISRCGLTSSMNNRLIVTIVDRACQHVAVSTKMQWNYTTNIVGNMHIPDSMILTNNSIPKALHGRLASQFQSLND